MTNGLDTLMELAWNQVWQVTAKAIIAEANRAVIGGCPLSEIGRPREIEWSKVKFLLQGDVVVNTGDSEIRAESIRFGGTARQFQFEGIGTFQLLSPAAGDR